MCPESPLILRPYKIWILKSEILMSDIFDHNNKHSEPLPATEKQGAEGDGGRSFYDSRLKAAAQELIKYGLLEATDKPNLYQICLHSTESINQILMPLDLQLQIDDIRGLAFLVVANADEEEHSDDWRHPLVRRQRMNLEQSLMVAILRQHFIAHELEAGEGDQKAIVHLDDLLPELNQFLGASGSDERDDKRLRNLLEQLKTYALVSEIDENDKIRIRPLIAHVANPENLKNLITVLKQHLQEQQS